MCIMMCIIMRAIGYYGATFFQPCFVSFADEQSAIRFVLEDWLITTLLCKCALKDMPMGRCAHCAHCAVHFLIDRKRLHVSVCPRAHVIHYTDLLVVVVHIHHLGGVRKSLVIHLPGEVHHLSVRIKVCSSYIFCADLLYLCIFAHVLHLSAVGVNVCATSHFSVSLCNVGNAFKTALTASLLSCKLALEYAQSGWDVVQKCTRR